MLIALSRVISFVTGGDSLVTLVASVLLTVPLAVLFLRIRSEYRRVLASYVVICQTIVRTVKLSRANKASCFCRPGWNCRRASLNYSRCIIRRLGRQPHGACQLRLL